MCCFGASPSLCSWSRPLASHQRLPHTVERLRFTPRLPNGRAAQPGK